MTRLVPGTADPAAALAWVVELLQQHGIPFQAVGGLAARAYGATRELADLDFYIPMERFPELHEAAAYVVWGPEHYRDAHWDIIFAKLEFAGQKIELGDSSDAFFRDPRSGAWVRQEIAYERSVWRDVLGVRVPVMPMAELIAYKRLLDRDVDRLDLAELGASHGTATESP